MEQLALGTLLSQWGSAGVVVAATAWAVVHQYREMVRMRQEMQRVQADHATTIRSMHKEHSDSIDAIYQKRFNDAHNLTQTLLSLQGQFNESVHSMSEQLGQHARVLEQVHQTMVNVERRVDLLERKGLR